jgi:hypothetical protein
MIRSARVALALLLGFDFAFTPTHPLCLSECVLMGVFLFFCWYPPRIQPCIHPEYSPVSTPDTALYPPRIQLQRFTSGKPAVAWLLAWLRLSANHFPRGLQLRAKFIGRILEISVFDSLFSLPEFNLL